MLKQQSRRPSRSAAEPEEPVELDAPQLDETPALVSSGRIGAVLLVPVTAILTCGSKEPWALGILAVMVGLWALLAAPRMHLSRWIVVPLVGMVALSLLAFLPASWFATPGWRSTITGDFGILTASTVSPQPGITLESWLLLTVGAVWMAWCLARGFTAEDRRFAVQALTIFLSLLAIAALLVRHFKVQVPFWQSLWPNPGLDLGPFPNRNNFSGLLAVGGVLGFAAAHDAFRQGQRRWMVLALATLPPFAGVLANTSRMGVVLFFGGLGFWMLTASLQRRSTHALALAVTVLLILATTFMLAGGQLLEKFTGKEGSAMATLAQDGRWGIFADTVSLMAQHPLTGVGLGNFESVFSLTRSTEFTYSGAYSRALHPESDWLWFGAETGIPCLILAVVGFVVLACQFGPWLKREQTGRRDRRLRNAAGVSVLLIAVEGLVDTPMHAPGFITLGALLSALALRPQRLVILESPVPRRIFRGAGVFCGACGLMWLGLAMGEPLLPGNSLFRRLTRDAQTLSAKGDLAGALEKWNRAAEVKPLQWHPYFERAVLKLQLGVAKKNAFEDFARARALEPRNVLICWHEFNTWMHYDPVYGLPAAREALRRHPQRSVEFFANFLGHVTAHPELRPHFRAMAASDPKLRLAYLSSTTGEEFKMELQALLDAYPELEVYTDRERLQLFQLWHARGDAAELLNALESNPSWREDGWTVLATQKAKDGNFRAAFELAMSHVSLPSESGARRKGSLAELNRVFLYNPTDISRGLDLYDAQRTQGLYDAALATLDQLSAVPQAPAKVLYERAVIFAKKGDYAKAWDAVQDYMKRVEKPS